MIIIKGMEGITTCLANILIKNIPNINAAKLVVITDELATQRRHHISCSPCVHILQQFVIEACMEDHKLTRIYGYVQA